MIAGTPTGARVATGLSVGYIPKELLEIYRKQGLEIFLSFPRSV